MTHGDEYINASYAAQGVMAPPPSGKFPSQTIHYYGTKYHFDDYLFLGIDAKETLFKMLKSINCIDGCKLVTNCYNNRSTSPGSVHGLLFAHMKL